MESFISFDTWQKYKKMAFKYSYDEYFGSSLGIKNMLAHNRDVFTFRRIQSSFEILLGSELFFRSLDELRLIYERRKKAMKRVRKYISGMFECYYEDQLKFLTFDIDDKYMHRDTRRKVKQWLDQNCMDYIANGDIGKKTKRKHYHAVVATKNTSFAYKYGNIYVEDINIRKGTALLSKYSNKLANHATKDSTLRSWHPRGKLREISVIPF